MEALADRLKEVVERCKQRNEDPEYQRNAARLEAEAAAQQVRSAEITRATFLRSSGIPQEHWSTLTAPRLTPAVREVSAFLSGPDEFRFLVLAGPKGRGKSFALSFAANQKRGIYVDAHDLVAASTFDREYWDDLVAAPLLAIDELGAESVNDSYDANLYALLNARYSRLRKTVIATNLDGPAFRSRYLAAGLDRLLDRLGTAGKWVSLPGESMRRPWQDTDKDEETP
jgi:DNA replication protein DnaC